MDADGHAQLTGPRLLAVGAKQAIPPGQVEAKI
ncbi:MAG: hypothetical protein RL659_346 [Pseudomonadota bacterium]